MPKLNSSVLWPLVVLAIAFGIILLKPWQTKQIETISVSAQGLAEATPNVGKITGTVESKNPNIDKARAENQARIDIIVTQLKDLSVEEKDIKTQNISAGEGYSGKETMIFPVPPRPDTNVFSTSLEITIRDFNKTDQILTTLTQNGLTNLYGPNLTVSDENLEEAKTKARENAVENAKKKASELARASGRKAGKVVKIAEAGDYGYPVPMMAENAADLRQKASQIQPGQSQVTVTLMIDFALD